MSSISRLFVGSIPFRLSQENFAKFFQSFGPVKEASVPLNRLTGMNRGFGFVSFENEQDARNVLSKEILEIEGRRIFVQPSTSEFDSQRFAQRRAEMNGAYSSQGNSFENGKEREFSDL